MAGAGLAWLKWPDCSRTALAGPEPRTRLDRLPRNPTGELVTRLSYHLARQESRALQFSTT